MEVSKSLGITLIAIPSWWDRSPGSLAATIQQHRPDIPLKIPPSKPIDNSIPLQPTAYPLHMWTLTYQQDTNFIFQTKQLPLTDKDG
jgi:hypothetical protein